MEIEIISYVSCLPHGISLKEWGKPETSMKNLQGFNSFLKKGYAILPNDVIELLKKGDEIEPIRNEPTPRYYLIADKGLEYFKKKDLIMAYDGVMLEIHSLLSAKDINQAINDVANLKEIHFSAADDFFRKIILNLEQNEDILLSSEYLTTFILLEDFDTHCIEYLKKANYSISKSSVAKKGEIILNSTDTKVPYSIAIKSENLKDVVQVLEATIIIDRGIHFLRNAIFNLEILPSVYGEFLDDKRRKFLYPLLNPTMSEKISEAEILLRDFKLTSDLDFEKIAESLFGVSSVNSYFIGMKNYYSKDEKIQWIFPDISKLVDTYDRLLNHLANSINQTLENLRTIRQHELEIMARNQQSFIILITFTLGFVSIAVSIFLAL